MSHTANKSRVSMVPSAEGLLQACRLTGWQMCSSDCLQLPNLSFVQLDLLGPPKASFASSYLWLPAMGRSHHGWLQCKDRCDEMDVPLHAGPGRDLRTQSRIYSTGRCDDLCVACFNETPALVRNMHAACGPVTLRCLNSCKQMESAEDPAGSYLG